VGSELGECHVRTNSLLIILQTAVFLFGLEFDLILDMTFVVCLDFLMFRCVRCVAM